MAATHLALKDAQFNPKSTEHLRPLLLVIGVSTSAVEIIEHGVEQMVKKGPSGVSSYILPFSPPQATASALSESLGVPTQTLTISTACPAGLDAIAAAAEMIRSGKADIAIAGGTDSPVTPFTFAGFEAAGLLSHHNDEPLKASRPFDLKRDSGVVSEGAGIVVLENLESALARKAQPYLEIKGYGTHMDTDHEQPASGLEQSMRIALSNSGETVRDVNYLCAHGAGHPILDQVETEMIKKVFGNLAYSIPISSIKGVIGNPLAAAGPLQVITCALAIKNQLIPPTANYDIPDPCCDLDYVGNHARMLCLHSALINTHGILGTNSSLLVRNIATS